MRALFVIILLAALVLPSGHASGSPPSDLSAADLQTQAAQGDANAQNNLGVLYFEGQGVPQDYAKARQWFEKAVTQGQRGRSIISGHCITTDRACRRTMCALICGTTLPYPT